MQISTRVKALDKFRRVVHPFDASEFEPGSQLTRPKGEEREGATSDLSLFSTSEIEIEDQAVNEIPYCARHLLDDAPGSKRRFVATGALGDSRSACFILECYTPLLLDQEATTEKGTDECRRYEIFLSVYSDLTDEITWMIHTISAGEADGQVSSIPKTSWALHPSLPLIAWFVAGQKLRLSHLELAAPPITLTGKIYETLPRSRVDETNNTLRRS